MVAANAQQQPLYNLLWNRACELAGQRVFPSKVRGLYYQLLAYDEQYPQHFEQTQQYLEFILGVLSNQIRSRARGQHLSVSVLANLMSKTQEFQASLAERGVALEVNMDEFYQQCNSGIMQMVAHT